MDEFFSAKERKKEDTKLEYEINSIH
jgi:hypothetical protein